ncbi:hypothetical protein Tco_0345192 [Tanacetum coccineum]
MPVSRQHHSRHFMVESADHLFAGPKLRCLTTDKEIIHETTKKIVQIQQRLQAGKRSAKKLRQYKTKAIIISILNIVLKVESITSKGVISDQKIKERLNPQYCRQYLPTFNLKKCLSDESLVIPMKELRLDDKLNFVEELVDIMD